MKKISVALVLGLFAIGCGESTTKPAPQAAPPNPGMHNAEMMNKMKSQHNAPPTDKKEGDAASTDKPAEGEKPEGDKPEGDKPAEPK